MQTQPEKITSLLDQIESMFLEEAQHAMSRWNSGGGDGKSTPEEDSYHEGRMDQTVFLGKKVRRILSDVIVRHFDSQKSGPAPAAPPVPPVVNDPNKT